MKQKLNKKTYFIVGALLTALAFLFLPIFSLSETSETIIYFPEDSNITFPEKSTEIQLRELKDENEYLLEWQFYSTSSESVYLRQDISLLFENGILVDKRSESKQNNNKITGKSSFYGEDSGKHVAISLHYAEVHYPEELIKSKRTMSQDTLYIIDSPLSPILTFREPKTTMEKRSKNLLDSIIEQQLMYKWEELLEEFQINRSTYFEIPFDKLAKYESQPFPSFTQEKTNEVLGKLWEGLYRYYILGVNTFTDKDYDPIGNTLPLILLHENGGHLLVLYETDDGTKQQLLQHIKKD
ncbi:hypothetical protein ACERII_18905 [Evansella sp. AB-rgal1]|uniref:hypothetical protein n=1 Tax=Evansella sp. AB-rgal1 TaxID=3242696 RepID=UPI00359D78B0